MIYTLQATSTTYYYSYPQCITETDVYLHANNGTNDKKGITTGEKSYTIPECTFSRTGYNFSEWNTEADGKGDSYNPNDVISLNGTEVNLYAQWTANQHSLTWDLNGGTVTTAGTNAAVNATGTVSGSVAYGTAIKAPIVMKTGYSFAGWHDGNAIVTPPNTMPDNNISYKAQWTANTYTVQFDANGGTGTMDNQSFTYDANPKALSANTFTRTGYNFTGWNTAADGTGTSYADNAEVQNLTSEPNGEITLYAQWEEKQLINFRTLCE